MPCHGEAWPVVVRLVDCNAMLAEPSIEPRSIAFTLPFRPPESFDGHRNVDLVVER